MGISRPAASVTPSAALVRLLRVIFVRLRRRSRPMLPHLARGNASQVQVWATIVHDLAAQKCHLGLSIHSIGYLEEPAPEPVMRVRESA